MHEIVTLQFGQERNFLATHFWNTQESYFTYAGQAESPVDHNVHFRPGIGADGSDTFTPRTVNYDLKSDFGSLRKINALYQMEENADVRHGLWDGNILVQRQPPVQQNTYQQHLDQGLTPPALTTDTVRYWSDFNRVFYHPRSIVQVNEQELTSSLRPFDSWDVGEELFTNLDKEHDLLDRDLRPFVEECDQLQGLQLLTSSDDAWGAFCARYVDRLRDEFGKSSIWIWGQEHGSSSNSGQRRNRMLNLARSFQEIAPQASVFVPITNVPMSLPPYITLDVASLWHTTALQASALESMTLPSRLRPSTGQRGTLDQMESALNANGNQHVAELQAGFGESNVDERQMSRESSIGIAINFFETRPLQTNGWHPEHMSGIVECTRGRSTSQEDSEGNGQVQRDNRQGPRSQSYRSLLPFPIVDSYPPIFRFGAHSPSAVAVRASLRTSSTVVQRIREIASTARGIVGVDDREALVNGLQEICEAYTEGYQSDMDSDDDVL